ncbi:cold shock domain-containing protein [Lacticaseibacillus pabuli]|uniref:Cold shock domain-containing protein n=1 Tax=Lacticaseibacillus pabuli TaxID=3025672 RepID=A0ABY7WS25_9LACO|nr:cold shock domain-containing protein [Lacticaseibacillus sp. KACC 23028]WDF82978.1 cold shock domain-containing protein [Lacticaseibacillus sp. KACC 23028]
MTTGTISWFSLDKGFGIIKTDDGSEVFMSYSAIADSSLRYPSAGQRVEFQMRESAHNFLNYTEGLRAADVRLAS